MPEILAPVGNMEMLYAAVRSGANAVYLGSENFNARRNAQNFTDDELKTAVRYCHTHSVKVYHTLNTLVKDREIGEITNELKRILERNEDALILQDLGLISVVKSVCPDIALHASTQLSVHTLSGVKFMENLGFKRVVLARELSKSEIKYIRDNTDIELEIFVHGALCMSVSGQCYFSSMLGGRSGNRGLCAQPCRLDFKADGGTGKDLSLKDNSLLTHLPEMAKMGIDSFKIEGRMKRPEYVSASVQAAKKSLNNDLKEQDITVLKNIFSRQGFTDGYYASNLGKTMFGSRSYEDVTATNNKELKAISAFYNKEQALIKCDISVTIKANEYPVLKIMANGQEFTAVGDSLPEPAINRAISGEEVSERVSKLGGTAYYAGKVSVQVDEGLSLRASEINLLRRKAIEGLENLFAKEKNYTFNKVFPKLKSSEHINNKLYARFSSAEQTKNAELSAFDKVIIPAGEVHKVIGFYEAKNVIAELPRAMFGSEGIVKKLLAEIKALGVSEVACGNVGSIYLAKEAGFSVLPFVGINVFNSYSINMLECDETLLSFEMALSDIDKIKSDKKLGIIIYGHMPLMLTRNCPVKNGKTCRECENSSFLRDRKGEKLPVRCSFGCSEIFNPRPIYMLDRLDEIKNTDFSLMYFTTENKDEIKNIMRKYRAGERADGEFTRGLYYKGVM